MSTHEVNNEHRKDTLFASDQAPKDFVFDEKVAAVFEDMINRSVPGYRTILSMIGVLAKKHYQKGSRIYDLGCSLGGASLAMASELGSDALEIVAVDNSEAMISKLAEKLSANDIRSVACLCDDILEMPIEDASVVVLNFTLQFIDPASRQTLMEKIYQGLRPGGILVVSEKILLPDTELNDLMIELYHEFKESQGYSKLEISQKRTALENVLIPETLEQHRARLQKEGFRAFDAWFQCFNFASMVAFK